MTSPASPHNANWLLRILVLFSLGIHLVVFLHISGLYRSRTLNYIELTMQDISKPAPREIPRPRLRPPPPEVQDVERPRIDPRPVPAFKPLKLEPVKTDAPDTLVEPIAMPELPVTPALGIARWVPPIVEDTSGGFDTAASYLDMVRLKIERHKKYPEHARARQIQGQVRVHFVITPEGDIRNPGIMESSRNASLDGAALQAVKDAAPFPKPPRGLFKGEVPLVVTVVFELI
jgi:periplasmic protein TonB